MKYNRLQYHYGGDDHENFLRLAHFWPILTRQEQRDRTLDNLPFHY